MKISNFRASVFTMTGTFTIRAAVCILALVTKGASVAAVKTEAITKPLWTISVRASGCADMRGRPRIPSGCTGVAVIIVIIRTISKIRSLIIEWGSHVQVGIGSSGKRPSSQNCPNIWPFFHCF